MLSDCQRSSEDMVVPRRDSCSTGILCSGASPAPINPWSLGFRQLSSVRANGVCWPGLASGPCWDRFRAVMELVITARKFSPSMLIS